MAGLINHLMLAPESMEMVQSAVKSKFPDMELPTTFKASQNNIRLADIMHPGIRESLLELQEPGDTRSFSVEFSGVRLEYTLVLEKIGG